MFYGNRAQKKHSTKHFDFRLDRHIIHRRFQLKYVLYLIFTVGIGSLIFLIPAYYFLSENYHIMTSFSLENNPGLLSHLEKEALWLKIFMLASFLAIFFLTSIVSIKMTKQLIKPLIQMERHMRSLALGEWNIPNIDAEKILDDDDFRDICLTYDHLHRSLKANMMNELNLINKLAIDPQNREAYLNWKKLIKLKQDQLGLPSSPILNITEITEITETSESMPVNLFSRRAS